MKKIICLFAAGAMMVVSTSCAPIDKIKEKLVSAGEEVAEISQPEPTIDNTTNDISIGVTEHDSYNPITTKSKTTLEACGFIYEPLFGLDQNQRLVNVLASSYQITNGGCSITVTLKDGVIWHDGSALKAADVAYTIQLLRMGGTNYDNIGAVISSVSIIDSKNITINFWHSEQNAAALLTFPIIKDNSLSPSAVMPNGTGPFYFNGEELTAFENHHDSRAVLDRIKLVAVPDKEKYISMFNANSFDIATSKMLDMSNYMPKANAAVNNYVSENMVFAGFNTKSNVFSSTAARKAVSALIDRDYITTHIYYQRASACEYAINPTAWINFDTRTKLKAEEGDAVKILSEGGWETDNRGKYLRWDNNKYFVVKILVNSESEERLKIAQAICEKMNTAGMQATVLKCSASELNARVSALNYDMFIGETELLPNGDVTELVNPSGNYFGYANDEVTSLLAQLSSMQTEGDIAASAIQFYTKLNDEVPFAPICFTKESIVTSAKIKYGVVPSVEGAVRATENWGVK